jgi:hypothetical protein
MYKFIITYIKRNIFFYFNIRKTSQNIALKFYKFIIKSKQHFLKKNVKVLIMHKKRLCVKKWSKIGSNIETKIMFFPITRRTLFKKPRKIPSQGSLYQTQKIDIFDF